MKKCVGLMAVLMVMAFVGDGFAARKPMGSFVVPNGKSAFEVWKANGHTNGTLPEFFESLRMKPKGFLNSCDELPSTGNTIGDMYVVQGQPNRLCMYNGTGWPNCPDGCDYAAGVMGPSGEDGCPPAISKTTSNDGKCQTLTLRPQKRVNQECTPDLTAEAQTQTVCNGNDGNDGDDGNDACFEEETRNVLYNNVATGCTQRYVRKGNKPAGESTNDNCVWDTTPTGAESDTGWYPDGEPKCPECSDVITNDETTATKNANNGCAIETVQRQTRNTNHVCVNNGDPIQKPYACPAPCVSTFDYGTCGHENETACPAISGCSAGGKYIKEIVCQGDPVYTYTCDPVACTPKPVLTPCDPTGTKCADQTKTGVKVTWKDCDNSDMDIAPSYVYSGDDGTTPTVEAGQVEFDDDPNFTPTVTNVGTASAARFNFKLPKPQAGADGKEVKLKKDNGAIQWQHDGDQSWQSLVTLDEIKGDPVCKGTFTIEAADNQDDPTKTKYTMFCVED